MQTEVDHGLALRGGVIAALLQDTAYAAIVGDRVYGATVPNPIPAWPWARVQILDAEPDGASGYDGEVRAFRVTHFARPSPDKPDAEAEALKGMRHIKRCLGSTPIVLELEEDETGEPPTVMDLLVRSSRPGSDRDEPGAYYGLVEFSAMTVQEA